MKSMVEIESLLNNDLGIIMSFDDNGRVLFMNNLGREELGYVKQDGINLNDIFINSFKEVDDFGKYVTDNSGKMMKLFAYRKNNTCFPLALRFSHMTIDSDLQINLLAGFNIQTEDDAIRDLKKAEDDMKETIKTRDEFVANITHELRTPVNGIKGHLNNLLETEEDSKRRYIMNIMMQCCTNMEKIINNLLDFSKLEAGKFEISERPFDFRKCIDTAMETCAPIANEKGIRFSSFVGEDIPEELVGDELRITQIINNLISNALKFTSVGYVTMEVYKTHQRGNQIELTFFVTDTGIGITPEQKEKLFKSFSQADGSITRKYGGTGLGLCVTKQLVELMHGHIEVDSEKGKGSTFTFTIKVRTSDEKSKAEFEEEEQEISIENLKNHSLGNITRSEVEELYVFGSPQNRSEVDSNLEKLILCIEMGNWGKSEMFAENLKSLCENADKDIKSKAFRLVMSVRKENYDKSINSACELRNMISGCV